METKDLVLLMGIPVLFISILIYTNNSQITGAVTAKETENNVIGTYSIMPSFKAKIDYNLDEYLQIKNKLKTEIIDECKTRKDIEECTKIKTEAIGWNCAQGDDAVLFDFLDKLKDCNNLAEDRVVCRFSMEENEKINEMKNERIFEIKVTSWYNKRSKAELIENKNILKTEFVDLDGLYYTGFNNRGETKERVDSIIIKILYKDGKPIVQEAYAVGKQPKIDLSKTFLMYKSFANVKFIDLSEQNNFLAPDPEKKLGLAEIIDLPRVKGMKFCVKSESGKQFNIYDKTDNSIKQKDIVYKFAITFTKSAPKPINDFEVLDAIKAENSVILTWSKGNERDIKSYAIYYSIRQDFIGDKIDKVKKDDNIKKILVSNANPIEIDSINLKECRFDPLSEPCKFGIYNKRLEKNKLYYWIEKNKFIYLLDAEDGVEHSFAITAINDLGDEIDNDILIKYNTYILTLGKNYVKSVPVDDLAPAKVENLKHDIIDGKIGLSWNKPAKNLDGSANKDVVAFNIYYKKSTVAMAPQLQTGYQIKKITTKDARCDILGFCQYNIENIENLEKGQNYNIAVTALDENSNEFIADEGYISVTIT